MTLLTKPKKKRSPVCVETAKSITEIVASAANIISPVWPLKTFIAVNPLQGLEQLPFEEAVIEAERHRPVSSPSLAGCEAVNRELIKWCSLYFDEGQATIALPSRHLGLYDAFVDLARYDAHINRSKTASALLKTLPETPEEAILESLKDLGVSESRTEEFLRQMLAALPGWAGYVQWKEHWQDAADFAKRPATLVEFLAVRLILTRILWPNAGDWQPLPPSEPQYLSEITSLESHFRERLIGQLLPEVRKLASGPSARPEAQLVFCIDVRSEPFRRAIEAQGNYETLGFAGFFGLPVRVKAYDDDEPHASCPVLLKPRHTVCDHPNSAETTCHRRHAQGKSLLQTPKTLYQSLKYAFATPFALVEMWGPWLGLQMLCKTFAPTLASRLAESTSSVLMPSVSTAPVLDDITLLQQVDYGEAALRLMGLTENLAPLVVFCGHGSSTTNNAFGSALDCGACGGNHGGGNARILAAILNNPSVRSLLMDRGLVIPTDTLFLAGEHNTTTDQVELYVSPETGELHHKSVANLRDSLAQARMMNAQLRSSNFGLSCDDQPTAVQETVRRSTDWAEVRPEWGLARNAAFIVGPRELTRNLNLEGRCFLHSYDWQADTSHKFLTTILTAPMVVAQWINSQYLFSTLDNVAHGAGSKITHNVTGKLGVMQGNASDLMHGLPLQSVYATDDQNYHEPQRLLTVVYAPRSRLDAIIESQDVLRKLFGNGWVNLVCIDPTVNQAFILDRHFEWQTYEES